jgi:hypothetical protein
MCCLTSYPKSFPFRTSALPFASFPPLVTRHSPLTPVFTALPYKIRLTPLFVAFTHFDRGGRVRPFFDLQTFRLANVSAIARHHRFASHASSSTYKSLFPQLLSFHIHLRCRGGVGSSPPPFSAIMVSQREGVSHFSRGTLCPESRHVRSLFAKLRSENFMHPCSVYLSRPA